MLRGLWRTGDRTCTVTRVTAPAPKPAAPPRIEAVDWLRGLAVIFMIQWHAFDAWLTPEAKMDGVNWLIRHMGGLPARMFLLLVGVSAAIRFESQLARGAGEATMRRQPAVRGLQIVGLAYLFRLQEHILAGFHGGWQKLFRVDILNAIGVALLLVALIATPRRGRPAYLPALLGAAVFLGLGPIVGPNDWFPQWITPLTSYIGGQRPMAYFPIFPWGAWALLGVAIGHLWVRFGRDPRGQARVFLLSGLIGVATTATVILVRAIDPYVIRYPSDLAQQMGPGAFFFRLGIIGALAAVAWAVTRLSGARFSVLKQLGRTSLLIYWIHVNLCYGGIARPLRGNLDIPRAALWLLGLIALMFAVSMLRTHYYERARDFVVGRVRTWRSPTST
jgi:uncharacterized membrane protein